MSGSTDSSTATPEITDLYDEIFEAMIEVTPSTPGRPSGFNIPSDQIVPSPYLWRPVGSYGHGLVTEKLGQFVDIMIVGDRAILAIKSGGGIQEWERRAQKNTQQHVTIIVNGKHEVVVEFIFDGTDNWIYQNIPLPEGLSVNELAAAEVEKDGRLLFSSAMKERHGKPATQINVNFFQHDGKLGGWAYDPAQLNGEFYGTYTVDGIEHTFKTSGKWDQTEGQKRRRFHVPITLTEDNLTYVEMKTFEGKQAERAPVWVFSTNASGFLISNPRRDSDSLIFTIIGQANRSALVATIKETGNESNEYPVDLLDDGLYSYFTGQNTVKIDLAAIQSGCGFSLYNEDGNLLGEIPSLSPLLTAAAGQNK